MNIDITRYGTIDQDRAHSKTSARYSFISTKQVLDVFAEHGFFPAKIQESRTRKEENHGFQKHIVRLRKDDVKVGDEYPEILLVNSHLGSAAFELSLGIFRLICSNGLATNISSYGSYKIRHTGYTDDLVSDAIRGIESGIPRLVNSVEQFKAIELTQSEQIAYAESAIEASFDGDKWDVDPRSLLSVRRYDDRKTDLWTTFNRVQENVIKGGIRAVSQETNRYRRTRGVNSVDNNLKLNRDLWTLTEKMAELKGAH